MRRVPWLLICVFVAFCTITSVSEADEKPATELAFLVRAQQNDEALAYLASMPSGERKSNKYKYLRARLIERKGDVCEAAEAFDFSWRKAPTAAAKDIRKRLAINLANCGECKRALPLLLDIDQEYGRRDKRFKSYAAECSLSQGEDHRAIELANAVLQGSLRGANEMFTRMTLALAHLSLNNEKASRMALLPLLVKRPLHADESSVFEMLGNQDLSTLLTLQQRLDRIESLYRRRHYDRVLLEIKELGRIKDRQLRGKALHLEGMSLFKLRTRYKEAAKVLNRAAKLKTTTHREDAFHSARALSRADRDKAAIAAYRRFARGNRGHKLAFDADYLASWLQIRRGMRAGESGMKRLLKKRRLPKSLRRKALWQLAFHSFNKKRYTKAILYLEQSLKQSVKSMNKARALYWLGRANHKLKNKTQAADYYAKATEVEPLHWYALLSNQRLKELGKAPRPAFVKRASTEGKSGSAKRLPKDVAFFSDLGLTNMATMLLKPRVFAKTKRNKKREQVRNGTTWFTQIGAPNLALRQARRMAYKIVERPDARNDWWWSAAYPTPWLKEVQSAAEQHKIEPWLVYATMRQESAYDANAVSRADAIGLLQMLEKTAERSAESLGVDIDVDRQKLFDPRLNIQLGVAEMAKQFHSFGGRFPLSIAAYNAGDTRVRRWLRQSRTAEWDVFVDSIPFDETRNYVRRVTSHFARYRYLQESHILALPKTLKY